MVTTFNVEGWAGRFETKTVDKLDPTIQRHIWLTKGKASIYLFEFWSWWEMEAGNADLTKTKVRGCIGNTDAQVNAHLTRFEAPKLATIMAAVSATLLDWQPDPMGEPADFE